MFEAGLRWHVLCSRSLLEIVDVRNSLCILPNQCQWSRSLSSRFLPVSLQYKPIAPLILVAQADIDDRVSYTFNLTAPGLGEQPGTKEPRSSRSRLAPNQSFEILWVKRVDNDLGHSYVYWFLPQ